MEIEERVDRLFGLYKYRKKKRSLLRIIQIAIIIFILCFSLPVPFIHQKPACGATLGHTGDETGTDIPTDELMGTYATPTDGDGTADDISVKVGLWDSGDKIQCAIYTKAGALVGETEERSTGGSSGFQKFDFAPGVVITNNTDYLLLAFSDSVIYMFYGAETGLTMYRGDDQTYANGFPTNLDWGGGW